MNTKFKKIVAAFLSGLMFTCGVASAKCEKANLKNSKSTISGVLNKKVSKKRFNLLNSEIEKLVGLGVVGSCGLSAVLAADYACLLAVLRCFEDDSNNSRKNCSNVSCKNDSHKPVDVVMGKDLGENGEITKEYVEKFIRKNSLSGKLLNIEISENVTELAENAFCDCYNLVSIKLNGHCVIRRDCFRNCVLLKSFKAYRGANILDSAFKGCRSLKSFSCYGNFNYVNEEDKNFVAKTASKYRI